MSTESDVNPIRYIEELARMPLRRHREPVPGTVQVYMSKRGKLYYAAGGLTSGELWWRAPCRVYDVDVAAHVFEVSAELASEVDGRRVGVQVTAMWQTIDPVAIVENRVSDIGEFAPRRLLEFVESSVRGTFWSTGEQLASVIERWLLPSADLPEGIRLSEIRATVLPAEPEDEVRLEDAE